MDKSFVTCAENYSKDEVFSLLTQNGACCNFISDVTPEVANPIFVGTVRKVHDYKLKAETDLRKKGRYDTVVFEVDSWLNDERLGLKTYRVIFVGNVVHDLLHYKLQEGNVIATLKPQFFFALDIPSFTVGPKNVAMWIFRNVKCQAEIHSQLLSDPTFNNYSSVNSTCSYSLPRNHNVYRSQVVNIKDTSSKGGNKEGGTCPPTCYFSSLPNQCQQINPKQNNLQEPNQVLGFQANKLSQNTAVKGSISEFIQTNKPFEFAIPSTSRQVENNKSTDTKLRNRHCDCGQQNYCSKQFNINQCCYKDKINSCHQQQYCNCYIHNSYLHNKCCHSMFQPSCSNICNSNVTCFNCNLHCSCSLNRNQHPTCFAMGQSHSIARSICSRQIVPKCCHCRREECNSKDTLANKQHETLSSLQSLERLTEINSCEWDSSAELAVSDVQCSSNHIETDKRILQWVQESVPNLPSTAKSKSNRNKRTASKSLNHLVDKPLAPTSIALRSRSNIVLNTNFSDKINNLTVAKKRKRLCNVLDVSSYLENNKETIINNNINGEGSRTLHDSCSMSIDEDIRGEKRFLENDSSSEVNMNIGNSNEEIISAVGKQVEQGSNVETNDIPNEENNQVNTNNENSKIREINIPEIYKNKTHNNIEEPKFSEESFPELKLQEGSSNETESDKPNSDNMLEINTNNNKPDDNVNNSVTPIGDKVIQLDNNECLPSNTVKEIVANGNFSLSLSDYSKNSKSSNDKDKNAECKLINNLNNDKISSIEAHESEEIMELVSESTLSKRKKKKKLVEEESKVEVDESINSDDNTEILNRTNISESVVSSSGTFCDAQAESPKWCQKSVEDVFGQIDEETVLKLIPHPAKKAPSLNLYQICDISGIIISIEPNPQEEPLSILQGFCHEGCRKAYSYKDFLNKIESCNSCSTCKYKRHYICPTCIVEGKKQTLCIYFSFEVHLMDGKNVWRIEVEHADAVQFIGCTPSAYIKTHKKVSEKLGALIVPFPPNTTSEKTSNDESKSAVILKAKIKPKMKNNCIILTFHDTSLRNKLYIKGDQYAFIIPKA